MKEKAIKTIFLGSAAFIILSLLFLIPLIFNDNWLALFKAYCRQDHEALLSVLILLGIPYIDLVSLLNDLLSLRPPLKLAHFTLHFQASKMYQGTPEMSDDRIVPLSQRFRIVYPAFIIMPLMVLFFVILK